MPGIADLFILSQEPDQSPAYIGTAFDPYTGAPQVNPADRADYLEGTPGVAEFSPLPGVPNKLDLQSDGVQAVDRDTGLGSPMGDPTGTYPYSEGNLSLIGSTWYDSERPNAGFPLPVPSDFGTASEMERSNDDAALQTNYDFGIDNWHRFGQPNLNPTNSRITERSFNIPLDGKQFPTFPAQIQKPRPWDRVMGAWPWTGTKDAVSQPVTSLPLYFPQSLPDGVPSATGAAQAMVPNTPSLMPAPMTFRVIPEQWDTDYVYSGQ